MVRVLGLSLTALAVANAFPHMKPRPYLFGHRGYSGNFPENTVLSFQETLNAGGNANELDCYTTKDGEYIVIHDSRVDRTTNNTGLVRDFTLEEIREMDAGWYKSNDGGETYPFRGIGIGIPTLAEVFEEISEGLINIDIKESSEEAADLCAKVIDEAEDRIGNVRNRVLAGSFDQSTTDYFQSISPTTPTYAGVGEASNFVVRYGLGLGGSFEPTSTFLELPSLPVRDAPDFHRVANDVGYTVIYFTINNSEQVIDLLLGGADGIMTDNVSQMAGVYRDFCLIPDGNLEKCLENCEAYLNDAAEIEICKDDHCGKLC